MKWFRFYSEALHDPKVQQLRPELFKFWVNCLCLANEQADRGSLPSIDELAFILRMKRPVVERFCNELVVAQLLHRRLGDRSVTGHCDVTDRSVTGHCDVTIGFMIHQWDARQPSSDNVSARVKKHRTRSSVAANGVDVTLHETGRRVTCNGLDIDRDSERDKERRPPIVPLPTPGPEDTHIRTGDDLSSINEAIALLASDIRTQHVAIDLGRQHNTDVNIKIHGWKWLRAVKAIRESAVADSKRGSFAYLLAAARNLTDADRVERPAPKQETVGARRSREIKEQVAAMKAKYAADAGREADDARR